MGLVGKKLFSEKVKEKLLKCHVCGEKGTVPAYYVDSKLGACEGQRLVACPKCVQHTVEILKNQRESNETLN